MAERCEYSSRKWCSVDPHVLEAGLVGGLHELELVHERVVLGLGIHVLTELRRVPLDEDPELHHVPPEVRRWNLTHCQRGAPESIRVAAGPSPSVPQLLRAGRSRSAQSSNQWRAAGSLRGAARSVQPATTRPSRPAAPTGYSRQPSGTLVLVRDRRQSLRVSRTCSASSGETCVGNRRTQTPDRALRSFVRWTWATPVNEVGPARVLSHHCLA